MNNIKAAREMIDQAARRLQTSAREAKRGSSAYAIRSAQECAELSLKAAMRLVGIDYPKKHDISPLLLELKDRFPDWLAIDKLAQQSSWLAQRREPSMYGNESTGTGPDGLFTRKDASVALAYAREIFEACRHLIHPRKSRKRSEGFRP